MTTLDDCIAFLYDMIAKLSFQQAKQYSYFLKFYIILLYPSSTTLASLHLFMSFPYKNYFFSIIHFFLFPIGFYQTATELVHMFSTNLFINNLNN